MAMFREHVAYGAIISTVVVVAVYFYALLTDPLLLLFLFGATVIGSFLPDVDSDSGMPYYLVYGTMSLAATGVVLLYVLNSTYAADWRYLAGIPAAALFVFWFIVGGVVKKYTHHRGIFHSLPALAISGLGAFLIARYYGLSDTHAWIFGGAMAAGYLCHLVLDEIHGGITLDGVPFTGKRNFGSALKLFSRSGKVNLATYLLLTAMAYSAFTTPALAWNSDDIDSTGRLAFYNDSDVIEMIDSAPPAPPPGTPGGGSVIGGSGGSSGPTGGGSGGAGAGAGGAGTVEVTSANTGNSGNNGNGSSGSSGSGASGGTSEILDLLVTSGALSGISLLDIEGSSLGSFPGGSISIVGDLVRELFSGRSDLRDVLENWRLSRTGAAGAREFGLIAASTVLSDANVEGITFSSTAFGISYRSRGYLLGIIPWTFPVSVTVIPQAPEGQRATVKLPWYNFFVREFFTRAGLAADIEETLKAAAADAAAAEDQNAILFEAVARLLRERIGTVAGSVL